MRLVSWNVNGLRAAERKGFSAWMTKASPDILSLQEIKGKPEQMPATLQAPPGYEVFWHPAERAGYSGVCVFTKRKPTRVQAGLGVEEVDREGRVLILDFPEFTLVNGYFPHARHDLSRLDYKHFFCKQIDILASKLRDQGKKLVLCGDYNIAHQDVDLANPKANRKNPGFLPCERAWMDRFLARGYRDVFREQYPGQNGHYTWWSFRKGVRERNVGWRIDYHCTDDQLHGRVLGAGHFPDVFGSDHCPVYLDLDI